MHAGATYQDRVAAWIAVQVLAEQDIAPPWDLPDTVTLEALHGEAPHPIDALIVTTSAGGKALAQAKHTVDLGTLRPRSSGAKPRAISRSAARISRVQPSTHGYSGSPTHLPTQRNLPMRTRRQQITGPVVAQ